MSEKFTDKNSYTILFVSIMVIIVATLLTVISLSLKDKQQENLRNEKMQNILKSVGIEVSREEAESNYKKYIVETMVFDNNGAPVKGEDAFSIDTNKNKELHPLYVAEKEGQKYKIIPVRGAGLWDAIWGFVSFNKDLTIHGVVFDHKGETPGLGAEITQDYFQDTFNDEVVFDKTGQFQGIVVQKGYTDDNNKEDGIVNAISGATITSVGVGDMVTNSVGPYEKYLKSN